MFGYRVSLKKGFTTQKLVAQLFAVLIALYVGGSMMTALGNAMQCTYSPFYNGLSLIGWTVTDSVVPSTSGTCNTTGSIAGSSSTYNGVLTGTTSGGVLAVVGIVALAFVIKNAVYIRK